MADRSISLIMPAFNEAATIEFSVRSAIEKLEEHGFDYEIFIFDDGSNDKTGEIADELAVENPNIKVIHNPKNMNLGYNFARGIELASKKYAGLLPCHGQTAVESFDYILPALKKADVVVTYHSNPEVRPLVRNIISRINVRLVNFLFGLNLRYYHLNFYRTDILKRVPTSTESYALMVELLVFAVKSGASYVHVPLFLKKRGFGKSKAMRPKNIINILKTYARLFWRIRILRERIDLGKERRNE
ncbi:MAG: glycosyltransferase family 2 protein [Candidatus Azambacteria bacterium]|nr:glycosyltransferase family 2 protein [Candidatus Azambacteria bacterium]